MSSLKVAEKAGPAAKGTACIPTILRSDESGRVVLCSHSLWDEMLRPDDVLGQHWQGLFSGFREIPIPAFDGVQEFLFVRESPDEQVYHVVAHDCLGPDGQPDGKLIAIEARRSEDAGAFAELEKTQCLGLMATEFAHELNNTLTSICGWLQILAQDLRPGDPNRESLEAVHGEARRTARMAAGLLAMAGDGADAPHALLDVNALLDAVLTLLEPSLRRKGIGLTRRFGELPAVSGSEDELRQVFVNLLLNAGNAIGEEGSISVVTRVAGDGHICVGVSDTGCGIPPDDLERIFEAFYTSRTEQGGTGLGLHVCRRIVRRHKGDLLVESSPGDGSTFTVVLPPASGPGADWPAGADGT